MLCTNSHVSVNENILAVAALSKEGKVVWVTAHTNFNSLLLHFVALEEALSAVRLMKDINADAVTISADLIWARRVHQLEARCFLLGLAHHQVSLLVCPPPSSTSRLRLDLWSTFGRWVCGWGWFGSRTLKPEFE